MKIVLTTFFKLFFFIRLTVHLDRASDLPPRGRKKFYDTIVKLCLLSSSNQNMKDIVQCSRRIKNSLNPHFHEDFYFSVDKLKILKKTVLRFSCYEFDRQGRHDALGYVMLPLSCHNKPGESIKHELPFKCCASVSFSIIIKANSFLFSLNT